MSRVRAPDLPQPAVWLNGAGPPSLKALRGRVVLLDFWTYGCINCQHTLPDLNNLEAQYGDRLVVLGVHTAKFEQERQPDGIQQAIRRYGIRHPVLVDGQRYLWDQYAIKAWPTFVVIDPQGYVVATVVGEGQRAVLEAVIGQLLAVQAGDPGGPIPWRQTLATAQPLPTPLAFPGKVLADAQSHTLFIADTGHHRIVMTGLDGRLRAIIGTGQAGCQDGDGDVAQFCSPQGLALDVGGRFLYVADSGNHLIRQIDLVQHQVSTLAGTGQQSPWLFPHGGKALETALNSPWDLVVVGRWIYVAIAGSHQIWQLDLAESTVQTLLGTGAEFCVDGGPGQAAFAQPSGITPDGTTLFVADSETSTIRAVTLANPVLVQTLCGGGQLFDFGDEDGIGETVRLQHCQGVGYGAGFLWVADTYNHKIKRVNPTTGECQTVAGTGQAGLRDGVGLAAQFSEPAGLAVAHATLYVADTNNHAIRCLDLASKVVSTLELPDLCSPFVCT